MGSWNKDGTYTPGRIEKAQQDKNRWRKRAHISEAAMKRIRAILQREESQSDTEVLDEICDVFDKWETSCTGWIQSLAIDRVADEHIRIRQTSTGDFVVSSPAGWLEGTYPTHEAALAAFGGAAEAAASREETK